MTTTRTIPAEQHHTGDTSCPAWCTLPAGHEPDTRTDDGQLLRTHGRGLSDDDRALAIELAATENIDKGTSGPPEVFLYADGHEGISPARLRALSDRLRVVADQLEHLQREATR